MMALDDTPPNFNKYLGIKGHTTFVPEFVGNTKCEEAQEFITKLRHPMEDKVPVILEPSPRSRFQTMKKEAFLVSANITVAAFYFSMRNHYKLKPEESLFFVVSSNIVGCSALMGHAYEEYKNPDDNTLYFTFCEENVYG